MNTINTEDERDERNEMIAAIRCDTQSASPFLRAADAFIEQHPELLRRLAQ